MRLTSHSCWVAAGLLVALPAVGQVAPQPPGQRPVIGIPEPRLPVVALAFTAPLAGSVAFPAVSPGGELTVRTQGGVLPITISVEAGANAALFEIARPGSGGTSASVIASPVPSGPANAIKEAMSAPTPAGPIERVLKFKGGVAAEGVPTRIPVTVVAVDGNGSRATLALTVLPVAPRLASVDSSLDPYKTIAFPVKLSGLGGASHVELQKLEGCAISLNPNVTYAAQENVTAGAATLSRIAVLRTTGTSCSATATIALRLPGRTRAEALITVSAPVKLAARQSYRFTSTWALRDRFDFRLHGINANRGTCTGDSIGVIPPFPSFPVGVREHGGDISMAIRSGPLSTTCFYRGDQWVLPDGATLNAFKVKQIVDASGAGGGKVTCSAFDISDTGDLATPLVRGLKKIYPDNDPSDGTGAGFTVSGWGPLAMSDGVTLLASNNRFTTVLVPTFARLKCFGTVTNDHGMRLAIDEIELLGPAGLTF